jgi:ATP-dependent Clp protease adapter protein ClpS
VGLWETPRARYADEVTAAITRASEEATRRRHLEVGTTHLLWSLLAAPSVEACLTAMSVAPAAARAALEAVLDALPRSGWMTFKKPHRTFDALLSVALELSADTASRTLTAPLLAGRLVSRASGESLCAPLARAGFTRVDFLRVAAHGDVAAPPPPSEGLVTVVLVDDPFTSMEHVVDTLREVFAITTDAEAIMLRVHRTGRGVIATMDAATAQQKIAEVDARASAAGLPLRAIAAIAASTAAAPPPEPDAASAPVRVSAVE